MNVVIKKWGNSASVRIPASIMASSRLHLDETVDIRDEAGRIIIESINQSEYELNHLLSGINQENLHSEISFGHPLGKEAL